MIENLHSIAEVEIAAARWAAHEMFGFGLWFDGIVRKHHGGEIGTGASVVESALSSKQLRQLGDVRGDAAVGATNPGEKERAFATWASRRPSSREYNMPM